jgi:outer membrane lipoprotein-sorting protein
LPLPTPSRRPCAWALPAAGLTALLLAAPVAHAQGPSLAVEDTMTTEVSEVLVRAPRVTLNEILDRVARGEARRDSLLKDMSFTATLRFMRNTEGKKAPELLAESVSKVYKKKPDMVRSVKLRQYDKYPEKDGDGMVENDFSPSMGETIVNFALRPENRRSYKFTIEDRKLLGDHLIYTLSFEPRSSLAAGEPSGRLWVDTREFVIVRQEIEFRSSPVPLFLKSIKRMVVERQRSGEFWVLSRALVRMELTVPMPRIGKTFDFGLSFTDYAINTGLPDTLFTEAGRRASARRGS